MAREQHWNAVYQSRSEREVSWFEETPEISLRLLEAAGVGPDSCVLDVGGGESRLVDSLIARGVHCLAVLDISSHALEHAQFRLGPAAGGVTWLAADVTGDWTLEPMDVWHDRAVFHFLIDPDDRQRYLAHMREVLKPGGSAIIATFALDGPEKCSGLPVARYSSEALASVLGDGYRLVESIHHEHETPWSARQSFQYSRFVRVH